MTRKIKFEVLTVALASAFALYSQIDFPTPAQAAPTPAPVSAAASATYAVPDFSALVEKEGPAVVNITVNRAMRAADERSGPGPQGPGPNFGPFPFGQPMPNQPRAMPQAAQGSGFIIKPDGYILTNAHVVGGKGEVTVKLTDKREFKAKVIGADSRTDVALLKIDASGLPTVHVGDPNQVKVGQWVAAIGSPFGFENSISAGIVSAKGRALPDETYVPFIQTDAAVNPGNSGGPLFNMNGEVVGINSQIYSNTGSYAGLSFAIPIDIANNVRGQLIATGHVTRGRIGVSIQQVTAALAESFGRIAKQDSEQEACTGQWNRLVEIRDAIEQRDQDREWRKDSRRAPQQGADRPLRAALGEKSRNREQDAENGAEHDMPRVGDIGRFRHGARCFTRRRNKRSRYELYRPIRENQHGQRGCDRDGRGCGLGAPRNDNGG
jgi:S1-C subfamily serine protease